MMGPLWRVKEPDAVVELWVAPVATGPVQIKALRPLAVVALPPLAQRVEPGGCGGGRGALETEPFFAVTNLTTILPNSFGFLFSSS